MAKLHLPEEGDMYTMPRLTPAPMSVWDNQDIPDRPYLKRRVRGPPSLWLKSSSSCKMSGAGGYERHSTCHATLCV